MIKLKFHTETIPISKLIEWEGNPRTITPEELEDLKQSFLASKMSSNSLVFIGEFVVNGKSYLADP